MAISPSVFRTHTSLLLTIGLLCCIEFLQSGMIAFASVPIRGEINASPEEYSLVAVIYACTAVIVISKHRWLTERLGWRTYIVGSVGIFILGALVCALSNTLAVFMLGRIIMALGGASFMTSSRVMVNLIPPGPGRFTGIKVFASALALGTASAPMFASIAVTQESWQAIFGVLIFLALIAGILSLRFLPNQPILEGERTSNSPARILLLGSASFFILYILQRGYYDFYNDTPILIGFAIISVLSLVWYFYIERHHRQPLLRVKELGGSRYVIGVALFSFSYMILGANNYMIPLFLQSGLGYSWEVIGLFQSGGLVSALITWIVMLQILPKSPAPKKFFVAGFICLVVYAWMMYSVTPSVDLWLHIWPALALNGCFIMLVLATTAMQTFRDVMHDEVVFAHAQQVKNMLSQIAMAIGTSVVTIFIQWRSTYHYNVLNNKIVGSDANLSAYVQSISSTLAIPYSSGQIPNSIMSMLGQTISQQCTILAGMDYFLIIALIGVLAALISVIQRVFH